MSLTNHHGESSSSRADKMSGSGKIKLKERIRVLKLNKKLNLRLDVNAGIGSDGKKFLNRKRRMFLKNPKNWDKI